MARLNLSLGQPKDYMALLERQSRYEDMEDRLAREEREKERRRRLAEAKLRQDDSLRKRSKELDMESTAKANAFEKIWKMKEALEANKRMTATGQDLSQRVSSMGHMGRHMVPELVHDTAVRSGVGPEEIWKNVRGASEMESREGQLAARLAGMSAIRGQPRGQTPEQRDYGEEMARTLRERRIRPDITEREKVEAVASERQAGREWKERMIGEEHERGLSTASKEKMQWLDLKEQDRRKYEKGLRKEKQEAPLSRATKELVELKHLYTDKQFKKAESLRKEIHKEGLSEAQKTQLAHRMKMFTMNIQAQQAVRTEKRVNQLRNVQFDIDNQLRQKFLEYQAKEPDFERMWEEQPEWTGWRNKFPDILALQKQKWDILDKIEEEEKKLDFLSISGKKKEKK